MWNEIVKKLKNPESLISLILGVVVVVLAGILVINMVKNKITKPGTIADVNETTTSGVTPGQATFGLSETKKYVVKEGETLWSIAMDNYKSGYNWVTIASANNLSNPDTLMSGQELSLPKAAAIFPEGEVGGVATIAITESSYTVKEGDSLWSIACQAYTNCYRYTEIAQANKLTNPSEIEIGQVLKLPR